MTAAPTALPDAPSPPTAAWQAHRAPDIGTPQPDPAAPPASTPQRPPADLPGTDPGTGQPPAPVREPDTAPPVQDLALPHERDQGPATGVTGPGPVDPVIAQAHTDLQNGLVDTDLRATAGLDAARRQALLRRAT